MFGSWINADQDLVYSSNHFLSSPSFHSQLFYFQRERDRKDESGDTSSYSGDLDHSTFQFAAGFKSTIFHSGFSVQIDAYSAVDSYYDDDLARNIENEFSFAGSRWSKENSRRAENGYAFSKSLINYSLPDHGLNIMVGKMPVLLPGLIGVNWSFQPGAYEGVFIKKETPLTKQQTIVLDYAWVNRYQAPWYLHSQYLSKVNAWDDAPVTGSNRIDFMHGLSISYMDTENSSNEGKLRGQFGVAQAHQYMTSYHLKLAIEDRPFQLFNLGEATASLSYHFYGSESDNDPGYELYDGLAWQQAIKSAIAINEWLFRFEVLSNRAEGFGVYLPRMTRGYANSQGANEVWWDSRSDWNHDGETALFTGVWYELDQWISSPDWQVGFSTAYGFGAKRWVNQEFDSNAKKGSESAWNIDLAYLPSSGPFDGVQFKLHFTYYNNHQDDLGSFYYGNMFTSERDMKFQVIFPAW